MPPKHQRQSPDNTAGNARDSNNPDEFTRVVKRRLATSTRTGQACDRCKVRKIRCDGLPGGCSPCIQNRCECKTTDRISQKAIPRGYVEDLERKCQELEARNKELEARLATIELEARTNGGYSNFQEWTNSASPARPPASFAERWRNGEKTAFAGLNGTTPSTGSSPSSYRPASFRPSNPSAHYLGISSGNAIMKSQALKILGIDIDLSSLDPAGVNGKGPAEQDDDNAHALSTIFGVTPASLKPDLPPQEEALQSINYYFLVSHPYLPILHKPTFMKIVERVYNDRAFEPTAAQIVCIHMILAIMDWQNASSDRMKNRGQMSANATQLFQRSRGHFQYSISLFYHLISGTSLEDLQAICLILQHMRSFPKPGRSWLLGRIAVSLCLECGLHRSVNRMMVDEEKPNFIEIECRKRVFWCIVTLEASLASKLGRPMSIRENDMDVEYPERVDDEFITENGILKRPDPSEDCTFDVALEMFKQAVVTMQIHSTLYGAIRPTSDQYVALVEDLEGRLNKCHDNTRSSLSLNSPRPERYFQAVHIHSWFHESRILLRHPSLSLSPSPTFTNECLRICVESSREILKLTDNLRKGNHYLDTTWYGATVQLLATLTILFSLFNKRDSITPEEIAQVKTDMDLCMDIMGDLGSLLGQPNCLRQVVQRLTDVTFKLLDPKSEKTGRPPARGPPTSTSPPALPAFTSAPNAYPAVTTTAAIPGIRLATEGPVTEPFSSNTNPFPPVHPSGNSSTYNIDPLVTGSDNSAVYENTNSAIRAFSAAQPANAFVTETSHPPNVFPWHWSPNESWRTYMQNISHIAGEFDPPETYTASALIALNQDCHNAGYGASGSPAPNGAVPPAQPGGFPADSWPATLQNFTYAADSAIRSVQGDNNSAANHE